MSKKANSFRVFQRESLEKIPQIDRLSADQKEVIKAVSAVLPFRVNNYVCDKLIDWDQVPNDPMFQLTFPQAEMLDSEDFRSMLGLIHSGASAETVQTAARKIQYRLNPHPAGQVDLNVPTFNGNVLRGMQHKYRETVLFFPAQGQTCHAYCNYCFRWAQFVGLDKLKFQERETDTLVAYLKEHKEVTDVLFTGGDPLIMKTSVLARYVEPLLSADLSHVRSIRFGTKSCAYWPYRFTTDSDADELMRLFEKIVGSGKHLAVMAHYSHPVELSTRESEDAIKRIIETGAVIRCQAPVVAHVNDQARVWSEMWQRQVDLGAVPYYMFVERDTGARNYFEVPLTKAYHIYSEAIRDVSGLARTVRGPSMSCTPGKVCIDGIANFEGKPVTILKFLQARNPAWANRVFFAKYDPNAVWFDDLVPAFGEREFFFEGWMKNLRKSQHRDSTTDVKVA